MLRFLSFDDAHELFLFAYSDRALYRQRILPIIKNLQNKVRKGTYNKTLAVKAFKYAVDDAAKRYSKEFGKTNFSVATRMQTAKELLDHCEDHIMEAKPKDDSLLNLFKGLTFK